MQRRALLMLVIALVLGAITVFLVSTFLRKESGTTGQVQSLHTVPVVVAASDLKIGTKLEKMMLRQVDLPDDALPEGHYPDVGSVLGVSPPVVLREMRRGEIVLPYKLSPQGARGGLPSKIADDRRAITIPVTEITGVAGFVTPGDYVDIIHTSAVGHPDNIPVSRILLQNVLVLGIDQVMSEDAGNPKIVNAVTLMVDVESGQRIALAQATGTLGLMLRNEFDASLLETNDVTWHQLEPGGAIPVSPAPAQTRVIKRERRQPKVVVPPAVPAAVVNPQVEIVRGLQVTKQTVPGSAPEPAAAAPGAAPATPEKK